MRRAYCLDIVFRHMFFRPHGFGMVLLKMMQPARTSLALYYDFFFMLILKVVHHLS